MHWSPWIAAIDCSQLFLDEQSTDDVPWSKPMLLAMLSWATLTLHPSPPFVLSVLLGAAALWLPLRSEPFDGPHRGEPAAVSLAVETAADIELAALDRL